MRCEPGVVLPESLPKGHQWNGRSSSTHIASWRWRHAGVLILNNFLQMPTSKPLLHKEWYKIFILFQILLLGSFWLNTAEFNQIQNLTKWIYTIKDPSCISSHQAHSQPGMQSVDTQGMVSSASRLPQIGKAWYGGFTLYAKPRWFTEFTEISA